MLHDTLIFVNPLTDSPVSTSLNLQSHPGLQLNMQKFLQFVFDAVDVPNENWHIIFHNNPALLVCRSQTTSSHMFWLHVRLTATRWDCFQSRSLICKVPAHFKNQSVGSVLSDQRCRRGYRHQRRDIGVSSLIQNLKPNWFLKSSEIKDEPLTTRQRFLEQCILGLMTFSSMFPLMLTATWPKVSGQNW